METISAQGDADSLRPPRRRWFVSGAAGFGLVAALFAASVARADEVKLTNGDVIHGDVDSADKDKVKVVNVHGNAMSIPWGEVASLKTDKVVDVKTIDGLKLHGRLEPGAKPGAATVVTEKSGPVPVDFVNVISVNEPEDATIWSGRIALGFTIQDGNTRSKTFFGGFDGEQKTKRYRIEAHAYYAYGSTEGILGTKKGFTRLQYALYVWQPLLYVYAGGALEYDRFQDLKLRSRGGAGLGLSIVETHDLTARLEVGAEYVNEDFFDPTPDDSYIAGRGAGHFDWWAVKDTLDFTEDFEVIPSFEKFRNFTSRSTSSANLKLGKVHAMLEGFGLAGVIIWQHVELPPGTRLRDDTTYIITLTYSF